MNRRNKEKQAGFSLVEVVVSTAILFSVAGAFLAMTAANGKLLAREHSLVQGAYELSALAQKGEGSPTGETFEVIFQGNEGDAQEVFSGYKVTDENGVRLFWQSADGVQKTYAVISGGKHGRCSCV